MCRARCAVRARFYKANVYIRDDDDDERKQVNFTAGCARFSGVFSGTGEVAVFVVVYRRKRGDIKIVVGIIKEGEGRVFNCLRFVKFWWIFLIFVCELY